MIRQCLLVVFVLFTSFSFAETDQATPQIGLLSEFGVVTPWGDKLSTVLSDHGLKEVPASSLFSSGWSMALGQAGWLTEVAGTRVSNTMLGDLSGTKRTRLVVDSTSVSFGRRWDLGSSFLLTSSAGVGVSRLLLQTYRSDLHSAADTWKSAGQGTFLSDWNLTPSVVVRALWRVVPVAGSPYGWVLGVGATWDGLYLPLTWKTAGDTKVSGLAAPWSTVVRPSLLVGIE